MTSKSKKAKKKQKQAIEQGKWFPATEIAQDYMKTEQTEIVCDLNKFTR